MRNACFVFLCLASAPTHALTQDEMREEFAVASGGTLVAKVEDGDIEIVTHDMERVVVEVFRKVRAATDDLERQVLKSHRVRISQDGSEVRIRARSWRGRDHIEVREFSVRFVVTVPQRFSARLRTSDGDIHVRGLEGALEARSSDGTFRLGACAAGFVSRPPTVISKWPTAPATWSWKPPMATSVSTPSTVRSGPRPLTVTSPLFCQRRLGTVICRPRTAMSTSA